MANRLNELLVAIAIPDIEAHLADLDIAREWMSEPLEELPIEDLRRLEFIANVAGSVDMQERVREAVSVAVAGVTPEIDWPLIHSVTGDIARATGAKATRGRLTHLGEGQPRSQTKPDCRRTDGEPQP
jgi:hypothetical protein